MRRVIATIVPMVALAALLGCGRRADRRAADLYASPEVPPPSSPSAVGGGPPVVAAPSVDVPDAALTPTFELDATSVLGEPAIVPQKGDAQADGPSGGTFGASSDDRSPGASFEDEHAAGQ